MVAGFNPIGQILPGGDPGIETTVSLGPDGDSSCAAAIKEVSLRILGQHKPIGGSTWAMRSYRTFADIEESYFREHPEEIDDYISIIFEEYAEDGDTGALLSSLRILKASFDL